MGTKYRGRSLVVRHAGAVRSTLPRRAVRRSASRHAEADVDSAFQELLADFPEPAYIVDLETMRYLEVNSAAAELFGYSRDECLAMEANALRPPEDVPRFRRVLKSFGPRGHEGDWRHLTRDGRVIEVAIVGRLVQFHGRRAALVSARDVTDRNRTLRELANHRDLMFEVQRVARIGSAAIDYRTGESNWSREIFEILGMQPVAGEPAEDDLFRVIHPDDLPQIRELWERRNDTSRPFSIRFRVIRPDGSERTVLTRVRIKREHGKPVGIIGAVQDITDITRAAEEVVHRRNEYEALLEAATEGIVAVDETGRITFANSRAQEMFGYSPGWLKGRPVEILVPAGLQEAQFGDRQHLDFRPEAHSVPTRRQIVARRKGGERFFAEISFASAETPSGRVVMALISDITRRKEAEDRVRRYAARLEALHDIDQAILNHSPAREIASRTLANLLDVVAGQRAAVAILADERDKVTVEAEDGLGSDEARSGGTYELNQRARSLLAGLETGVTLQLSDLAEIDGSGEGSRLFGWGMRSYVVVPMLALDQLIGFLMLGWESAGRRPANDISVAEEIAAHLAVAYHHVRAAAQEKSRAERLEATVIERTRELEERNQDLETFAYSVSHDLRAPLRAMRGFGEAILEDYGDVVDDVARDFMTRIVDAAAQMDSLIQDLLHYSRVARQQIDLHTVSVRSAAEEALSLVSSDVSSAGAIVKLPNQGAQVSAHGPTLVLALSNLIGNALKFRREDKRPEVVIRGDRHGSSIRILVQDNGIGIKAAHQERIFRIFERLHSGDVPGTGLGLAIVKKGVERMGGNVGVESTPGEGSTFWIELPAASS